MAKTTSKGADFAKGGSTKMFGKQVAGPQRPGCTAHDTSGDGGKFASGGSTKMFGKQAAGPMPSGQSGKN